jgi:hypothetical protein
MSNNKRASDGKFASKGMTGPIRDNPWTSAAIAAGAAGIGAFLWSKRSQISDTVATGMDRLSELKAERMGGSSDDRSQAEIAEEALTLKETGAKANKPQASNQEAKAGAKAFS